MDAAFPASMMPNIEKFFSGYDAKQPLGRDIYDGVFLNEGFFPLQRKRELIEMIAAAKQISPMTVMEIGADKGGGFYHWVKCLPTVTRAIAIEVRGVPYAREFEKAFRHVKFLFRGESSRAPETITAVQQFLGQKTIDVLFIDGDKSRFFDDFDAYHPFMRSGGLVFMHDITDPAPGAAFRKAAADPRISTAVTIINTDEVEESLRNEADGIPPTSSHEGWLRHWKGASCGVGVLMLK